VTRGASGSGLVAIPVYQALLVTGTALILVGLLRFMGRRERMGWLVTLVVAFVVGSSFFTFVVDGIVVRSVTFYVAIAGLYVIIVWALARYSLAAFRGTARATAVVFALAAVVYLMLALVWVVQSPIDSGFSSSSPVTTIAYLASLSATVLWTFGLVAMVNQRLASEVAVDARNMHAIFATGPDGAIISRLADGVIDDVNVGFTGLTGYERDEVIGQSAVSLGLWAEEGARDEMVSRLRENGSVADLPMVVRRKDGSTVECILASSLLTLDDEPYLIAVIRDATMQRRMEAELLHEATTDSLTDLPNRRHFLPLLDREIRRSGRVGGSVAVALLDIDHFKEINDTHGHAAGDTAVVAFATAVRAALRDIDTLGRLGGDEFGVVLPEATVESAVVALERVLTQMTADPLLVEGRPMVITFSAGVAGLAGNEDTVDTLLARADAALYRAKEQGRNRVVS
jgi:diguanylate cyclase (GGDEF)-like protein/PAS domain S-box-containing protein